MTRKDLGPRPRAAGEGNDDHRSGRTHHGSKRSRESAKARSRPLVHDVRLASDGDVVPVVKIPTQRMLTATKRNEPATTVAGSRNASIGAEGGTRTPTPEGTGT